MNKARPQENPLVNNRKLRRMYVAMAQMRALDEYVAGRRGKGAGRLGSVRGQEACRVSTALELVEGDLVSDSGPGVAMDLVAGATVASLLRSLAVSASGAQAAKASRAGGATRMPWVEDAGERLRMALGASLALKTLKRPNLVAVYARGEDVSGPGWRRVLGLAAELELPVIFVILPSGLRDARAGVVSAKARLCGVPAIPVDANDAVALYRVAQESIGRARSDGGPVVIECAVHRPGRRGDGVGDPIAQMQQFLLERKVSDKAWMEGVAKAFRRRLGAR